MRRASIGRCRMLLREPVLHRLEQVAIENGLVLGRADCAAIDHLADVEAVAQQIGERAAREGNAAMRAPVRQLAAAW